jgi:hypothetical protein
VNQAEIDLHLQLRRKTAANIIAAADQHKVCSQCCSLSLKTAPYCPACGAYRWLESAQAVEIAALSASTRPWPLYQATVPRIVFKTEVTIR